jgi:hypothetical protein
MNPPTTHLTASDLVENPGDFLGEVVRASLIVAPVANITTDPIVHYVCGLVVARPTAGVSRRKLNRRVILVVQDQNEARKLLCDSATRVNTHVLVTLPDRLSQALLRFGETYRRWRKACEEAT